MREIVVSGIRSTGNLHLGNYYGALRNFVKMQHENDCYFFIADLHSLTTHPDPKMLPVNVKSILAEYLAAGLDPEACSLFIQSDVPEVSELYLLLNMHAYIGELERTASFKDKVRKQPENVNAGFARRFNTLYGVEYFPEPTGYNFGEEAIKIPGLDGSGKMGKSEGNCIYLLDDEKTLRKKVMRAVTDEGPQTPNSPKSEPIANLFTIMKIVSAPETLAYFEEKYNNCEIRYGDMKKQLADDILKVTLPIRERILEIKDNDEYMRKIVAQGAEKARESAAKTLRDVKEIMGIRYF